MIHGRKPGRTPLPLTSRRWSAFRSASPGFDLLREDMVSRGAWPEDRFKSLSQQFQDLGLDQVSDAELEQRYPGVPFPMIPATHHISRMLEERGAAKENADLLKGPNDPLPDLPAWQDGVGIVPSKVRDAFEKVGASQQNSWGGLLSEVAESSLNYNSKDVSEDDTVQPEAQSSSALPDIRHIPGSRTYVYNDPVEGARNVTPFADKIPGFDWHRDRNIFNFVPRRKPEPVFRMTYHGNTKAKEFSHYEDHQGNKWRADYLYFTGPYHGYRNYSFRGTGQYVGCQAVYTPNGQLMLSGPKRSTFDYEAPSTISQIGPHKEKDVNPHNANSGYRDPDVSTAF